MAALPRKTVSNLIIEFARRRLQNSQMGDDLSPAPQAAGFVSGVLRLGCSIAVGLTVAVASVGLVWYLYARHQASKSAQLAEARTWSEFRLEALGKARATLSTKWQNGDTQMRFTLAEVPAIGLATATATTVTIRLLDKDGFEIHKEPISAGELLLMTESAGQVTGLQWTGTDATLSADEYQRIAAWSVSWTGLSLNQPVIPVPMPDPVVAPPVLPTLQAEDPRPKWQVHGNWLALKTHMFEDDVERLLGTPVKVITMPGGRTTWWCYSTAELEGPNVWFSNGQVAGWRSPDF